MYSNQLAEFYGAMFGDGCLSQTKPRKNNGPKYYIYFCGHKYNDRDYLRYIQKIMKLILKKDAKIKERKEAKTAYIKFCNKKIFLVLKKEGMPVGKKYDQLKIPKWVRTKKTYVKKFIRGLFDTDGCFYLSKQHKRIKYYPRIEITSKSKEFLSEVKRELERLLITSSLSYKGNNAYRLEISGKERIQKWMKEIGSSNNKHLKKIKAWKKRTKNLKAI